MERRVEPGSSEQRSLVRRGANWLAVAGCAVAMCQAAPAQAGGFAAARFGGEHGHPTTSNPTAIYYNPAGLALSEGTHIFLDASLALRSVSYDRPLSQINSQGVSQLALSANSGESTLFNPITAPFAGISSDFGTDFITAGIAWYYPFGGTSVWDSNSDFDGGAFPGASDGTQRWYSIDGIIRSMYITGAVAFNIRQWNLSIGVSGSAIRSEVHTLRARNGDGTDDLTSGGGDGDPLKEGRSEVDVNGWNGGFAVGVIWEPKPDTLWLGFSYTSQPGVSGEMSLEGKLRNALTTGDPETTDVEFRYQLPDIVRFGARIRPMDDWEFRFFGDYTRWSVFDRMCLLNKNVADRNCSYSGMDNALNNPGGVKPNESASGVVQHLPRKWQDTFGLRVGASWWVIPELETYLGAGYDSNAIPDQTLDPALTDADKVTLSLGARWQIVENFAMATTFTQVLYFERDTSDSAINNQFTGNTRQPGNGGVYNQSISLINLYADISF